MKKCLYQLIFIIFLLYIFLSNNILVRVLFYQKVLRMFSVVLKLICCPLKLEENKDARIFPVDSQYTLITATWTLLGTEVSKSNCYHFVAMLALNSGKLFLTFSLYDDVKLFHIH